MNIHRVKTDENGTGVVGSYNWVIIDDFTGGLYVDFAGLVPLTRSDGQIGGIAQDDSENLFQMCIHHTGEIAKDFFYVRQGFKFEMTDVPQNMSITVRYMVQPQGVISMVFYRPNEMTFDG